MSELTATVKKIENCDNLHIVYFDFNGQSLSMMSLELDDVIQVGTKVQLAVKPSHIAIGKNCCGELSDSNQLQCTIISIENGQLLSSVILDFFGTSLESIITMKAVKNMDLKVADKVTAFINASELSIQKVC